MTDKQLAILIFGAQGSGKSTQAEVLSRVLHFPLFDAGDQLRALSQSNSQLGRRVKEKMTAGSLVGNDVLRYLLVSFVEAQSNNKGIVIDGFPRNDQQCEVLTYLAQLHNWRVIGVYIAINDNTAKERLAKRFQIINGAKVVRNDDRPEIVEQRLALFKSQTLPVIKWLKDSYTLLEVDGEPPANEVSKSIIDNLRTHSNVKA